MLAFDFEQDKPQKESELDEVHYELRALKLEHTVTTATATTVHTTLTNNVASDGVNCRNYW